MSISVSCTCGQTFTAFDSDAGRHMACPHCGALTLVPGSSATSERLGYVSPATGNPSVTELAVQLLKQTSLWVRIMSILMFIGAGFMILAAGALILLSAVARGGRDTPPAFLGCVYVPMSILCIVPAIFLWRYATHAKAFAAFRHEHQLEAALQAQKSFWKFVAITALVVIGLYIVIILVAMGLAIASARP